MLHLYSGLGQIRGQVTRASLHCSYLALGCYEYLHGQAVAPLIPLVHQAGLIACLACCVRQVVSACCRPACACVRKAYDAYYTSTFAGHCCAEPRGWVCVAGTYAGLVVLTHLVQMVTINLLATYTAQYFLSCYAQHHAGLLLDKADGGTLASGTFLRYA